MVEVTPSFELEFEPIDRDHRRLTDMINDILAAIDAGSPDECEHLVPDFVEFAKKHFQREDAFLEKVGYPNRKWHVEHHSDLDNKMHHIVHLATQHNNSKVAQDTLRKELVYFLMDDIINADLDFKPYLIEQGLIEEKKP